MYKFDTLCRSYRFMHCSYMRAVTTQLSIERAYAYRQSTQVDTSLHDNEAHLQGPCNANKCLIVTINSFGSYAAQFLPCK